jgi:alkylation response protein AidB-like acyl-CoA dehydrogenase
VHLPTDEQRALGEACREVLGKHSTSRQIRSIAESGSGHDTALWRLTADLGWNALAVPEDLGGLGGSACDLAVVAEEFGRASQPSLLVQTLAVAAVLSRHAAGHGPARDLLGGIASGDAIVTWAVGEPDAGDPLTVDSSGDMARLTGRREYVPDAQCATHAVVRADSAAGPCLAIVPLTAGGVSVAPMQTIDIMRRYCRLTFAGTDVPAAALLGGRAAVQELFHLGVVLQCAESAGAAGRLLEMTVSYAGQRYQFGEPIGRFQAIKHRIADMLIETEGCRVATREAAEAIDACGRVREAVSVAKSWTGRAASFVASHALQIHGGIGFSWEHDLHLYLRRAKANELLLGTPRWHEERLAALLAPSRRPT